MKPVDPAQRKNEIVAVTFDLIARDGIESATMRQVATAAGATTGRVTHHFATRAELLVGTLAEDIHGRTSEETVGFSLLALIDDPAHRLMLDTNPKSRRAATRALDDALQSVRTPE